jgi:hypothetical protein
VVNRHVSVLDPSGAKPLVWMIPRSPGAGRW